MGVATFFIPCFGAIRRSVVSSFSVGNSAVVKALTFNGVPIQQNMIWNELTQNKHNGRVRVRGSDFMEFESYGARSMGVISRGDIKSINDLKVHTYQPIGISTTNNISIARKFAMRNDDMFSTRGKPECCRVIHFYDIDLIPKEHKTYIPAALGDSWQTAEEEETVLHGCVPAEIYIGNVEPAVLSSRRFDFNAAFVDSLIVKSDPELFSMFQQVVYRPFSEEVGPKIREKKLTDFKKENYQNGRKMFREAYERTKQGFFASLRHNATKEAIKAIVPSIGSR